MKDLEVYAKIYKNNNGVFKYSSDIWLSEEGIDSKKNTKSFLKYNSARVWSEKQITKTYFDHQGKSIIKDKDILRSSWND